MISNNWRNIISIDPVISLLFDLNARMEHHFLIFYTNVIKLIQYYRISISIMISNNWRNIISIDPVISLLFDLNARMEHHFLIFNTNVLKLIQYYHISISVMISNNWRNIIFLIDPVISLLFDLNARMEHHFLIFNTNVLKLIQYYIISISIMISNNWRNIIFY